ncbi:unnamed protein product, partial [Trichobilharzia regenti]
TTENENTVNRRITRRSCKTTDTKTDEFEDDSWSIEENIINSSFQNNSNNNINPDSTFDGSEANDPLVSDVTHSSDSNTSQKETPSCADVEKSLESSDPFVRLTR